MILHWIDYTFNFCFLLTFAVMQVTTITHHYKYISKVLCVCVLILLFFHSRFIHLLQCFFYSNFYKAFISISCVCVRVLVEVIETHFNTHYSTVSFRGVKELGGSFQCLFEFFLNSLNNISLQKSRIHKKSSYLEILAY